MDVCARGVGGGGACALSADLTMLHLLLHGGVTCQLLHLPFQRSLSHRCLPGPRENAGGSVIAEVQRGAQLGDMQNRQNCQSKDAPSLIRLTVQPQRVGKCAARMTTLARVARGNATVTHIRHAVVSIAQKLAVMDTSSVSF